MNIDRISELPESLLHNIMAMMPIKYAARMSTLSKEWNRLWQTLPFLNFYDEFYLPEYYKKKGKRYIINAHLMRKATQIVLSRCQGGESANLLKLRWVIPIIEHWQEIDLNNWKLEFEMLMHNVSKTKVRQLCLTNYNSNFLSLPSPLILPKLINQLLLKGFLWSKNWLPARFSDKFQYLSVLTLQKVNLEDDEIVNGLNVTCPFLTILYLGTCFGLKNLHLTGFLKLKILILKHLHPLETVKIEFLPLLIRLNIEEKARNSYLAVDLDNRLCHSLINLLFIGEFLTDDFFHKFICKCRYLQNLVLGNSKGLKKVIISMHKLSYLRIFCMNNLDKVEINAPMLRYFFIQTIVYNKPPTISWKFSNSVSKIFVVVHAYEHDSNIFTPNDDMLENWRDFFGYFSNARKLKLLAPTIFLNWLEREWSLSPLCCVKDLLFFRSYHESPPQVMHLLKSLIFLTPRATTLSIFNVTTPDHKNTVIFANMVIKFLDDDHNKDVGETSSSSNQFQFLGIESWLQSVSEVTIQEFKGKEFELKELNDLFGQVKNFKPINLPSPCLDIDFPFYHLSIE